MRAAHLVDLSRSPHAVLRPAPLGAVELEGGLWGQRLALAAGEAIEAQHRALEEWGALENFRRAGAGIHLGAQPTEWADSDLYKWLEAASWLLAGRDDAGLRERVDAAIALVEAAQAPDGYVDTFYAGRPAERWSDLQRRHELYCLGHLLQAAVAHHRATGGERLLRVARRAADLACTLFGPGPGQRPDLDGHPGIELALVELHRETAERRYLELARHFVEARGRGRLSGGRLGAAYYVDHAPLRALEQVAGHAVRALYYLAGATDLYLEDGDPTRLRALERLWTRMVQRQLYVTGGLGARREAEAFGDDLELPGRRACSETCAAVASVLWSQRLLAATGAPRHADLIEWTLLNALLAGWSLDGREYFYENPLEDDGRHRRRSWFECACCPPNLLRLVAALPALLYGLGEDTVHVHQYASSRARLEVGGRPVELRQRTRYPWDGEVELVVEARGELGLALRVPGWCGSGAALSVNGEPVRAPLVPGTSVELRGAWRPGDRVALSLPMPVRCLRGHPRLRDAAGRVALARGPLLYCLEGVDHPGVNLEDVEVDPGQAFAAAWREELLGGVVALRGAGVERTPGPGWDERLYAAVGEEPAGTARPVELLAVPYHAWANRAPGPLQVWLGAAR
jgi:DUF1680 family protein